jgi:hypothetical protein
VTLCMISKHGLNDNQLISDTFPKLISESAGDDQVEVTFQTIH